MGSADELLDEFAVRVLDLHEMDMSMSRHEIEEGAADQLDVVLRRALVPELDPPKTLGGGKSTRRRHHSAKFDLGNHSHPGRQIGDQRLRASSSARLSSPVIRAASTSATLKPMWTRGPSTVQTLWDSLRVCAATVEAATSASKLLDSAASTPHYSKLFAIRMSARFQRKTLAPR